MLQTPPGPPNKVERASQLGPAILLCAIPKILISHTAEADVGHAGVGSASNAGAGAVVETVSGAAEEGAAALDALGWMLPRLETERRPGGVDGRASAGALGVGGGTIPVGAPLPDVAGHVVKAIAVGRERFHRRSAGVAVAEGVLVGEASLEIVALRLRLGER